MKAPAYTLPQPQHKRVSKPKEDEPQPPPLNVSYLDLVKRQHEEEQREDLKGVSFAAALEADRRDPQALVYDQFADWVTQTLGHPLTPGQEHLVQATYQHYGPFRKEHLPSEPPTATAGQSASERLLALMQSLKQNKFGEL